MRRRPMLYSKMVQINLTGQRAAVGAALVALLAIALPGSAQAIDPITYTIDGIQGTNGWYQGSSLGDLVRVRWSINVDVLDASKCGSPMQVTGPTTGTVATCTVTLTNGQPLTWPTSPIKIDAAAPTSVSASLTRAPDFNGWYNHPVGVSWQGADTTSGIASCSSTTYGGPDRSPATLTGTCTDVAGNKASASVSLSYDATAPVLSEAAVDSRNGSDVVSWKSSSPSDTAVVQRWQRGTKSEPVVFRGAGASFQDKKVADGLEYTYAVQTFDQAGNASKRVLVAGLAKIVTMRKLPYVPRVADKPILQWATVKGADYYNVQLYRGPKRVYAAWPTTNHLGLPTRWRWNGKRHRLSPGKYRWYVWAGFGARSFARYRTVGSAQFVVPR